MSIRLWRVAPKNLARVRLVLSPGHARCSWIVWCALVAAALLAGAAASHAYWSARLGPSQSQAALKDVQQLQQAQEQSRLKCACRKPAAWNSNARSMR